MESLFCFYIYIRNSAKKAGSTEISRSCRLFLACRRKGEYNVYNYENMGNICI